MKTIKTLMAIGALSLTAGTTHAATYLAGYTMTTTSTNIGPPGYPVVQTNQITPDPIRVEGLWDIDIDALTFFGTTSSPAYNEYISIVDTVNQTTMHSWNLDVSAFTQTFGMGPLSTAAYDAQTRTLVLTDIMLGVTELPLTCTSTGYIDCSIFDGPLLPPTLNFSIVFDESMQSFTAASFYTDYYGNISQSALYTGMAVPVPAAAWLFGSGLLGLTGSRVVAVNTISIDEPGAAGMYSAAFKEADNESDEDAHGHRRPEPDGGNSQRRHLSGRL